MVGLCVCVCVFMRGVEKSGEVSKMAGIQGECAACEELLFSRHIDNNKDRE